MPTLEEQRRLLSRWSHRFGFGPKPGQFSRALNSSIDSAFATIVDTSPSQLDRNVIQGLLGISDLGVQPAPNTPQVITYANEKRRQIRALILWWIDHMTTLDYPLAERMTWFWHGHWATSYQKVDEPLLNLIQNFTLRRNALGNFRTMCREMVVDPALILWLDGQSSTAKAPNENLARELMELFILGVDRYTENDVKQAALALTGYRLKRSSGDVTFLPQLHFSNSLTILGRTSSFDGPSLTDYLVSQENCARFIAERFWFRFVSSTSSIPKDGSLEQSFANRDISSLLTTVARHPEFNNPAHSQVKAPLDWLISALRALNVGPYDYPNPDLLVNSIDSMGQKPFFPPNVGGWPADEAWLSTASTQTRISLAQTLVKFGDLSPIADIAAPLRIEAMADWLGVARWSDRTLASFVGALNDPARLTLLGLCSPEYVVNA